MPRIAVYFGLPLLVTILFMEKTQHGVVVPLDAGWSDVGSWSALHEAIAADEGGNVLIGDVLTVDAKGCYLQSTSRLVAAVGLEDHVVVETKDAVLVAPKSRVQDVKELVAQLKKQGRYETSLHREVFRPWGSYDSIDHEQPVRRDSRRHSGAANHDPCEDR